MDKLINFKLSKEGLNGVASTRGLNWSMDEPLEDGGTNLAPTPMDCLYGALAGCIAITIRMYAQRKGWDTGEIDVDVYEVELENKEKEIHKRITFGNQNLTKEQLDRIYKISNVCPVSKVLSKPNNIILDNKV